MVRSIRSSSSIRTRMLNPSEAVKARSTPERGTRRFRYLVAESNYMDGHARPKFGQGCPNGQIRNERGRASKNSDWLPFVAAQNGSGRERTNAPVEQSDREEIETCVFVSLHQGRLVDRPTASGRVPLSETLGIRTWH